ncbi:hypothetical protein LTR12_000521 [Friedmanniomyces endolithicus]|nr:hypothetical protein LTR12_000521 [Friedmanniomyces endolithicus]
MLQRMSRPSALDSLRAIRFERSYAAARHGAPADEADLSAARIWLSNLNPNTIPRTICQISFSRSSGPGGQNVNNRYHAARSNDLVIQADESRKQADNVEACFRKLSEVVAEAGREAVPGETSAAQGKRVEGLQKAEAAGRRRMKEMQSKKKSARRGGGGRDEG